MYQAFFFPLSPNKNRLIAGFVNVNPICQPKCTRYLITWNFRDMPISRVSRYKKKNAKLKWREHNNKKRTATSLLLLKRSQNHIFYCSFILRSESVGRNFQCKWMLWSIIDVQARTACGHCKNCFVVTVDIYSRCFFFLNFDEIYLFL